VLAAQAAQMQVTARSSSGTRASRSGGKEAATHQQDLPLAEASAMTQALGPPQRGQTLGRAGAMTGFDTKKRADGAARDDSGVGGLEVARFEQLGVGKTKRHQHSF
jgi:hypothetical protein